MFNDFELNSFSFEKKGLEMDKKVDQSMKDVMDSCFEEKIIDTTTPVNSYLKRITRNHFHIFFFGCGRFQRYWNFWRYVYGSFSNCKI